jgi:ERF superfamily
MSVHKKLMQVRVELAHLSPQRTGHNKFAGYKYFELSDFIPPAMELFLKHGLCGYISYSSEEAILSITDVEDGTIIVIRSPMATAQLKGNHDIQNLGAVQSYQRRYLWIAALELCETDPVEVDKQLAQVEHVPPQSTKVLENTSQKPASEKKKDYKVLNPKPTVIKESKEFPGLEEVGTGEDKMVSWEIKVRQEKDASNEDWRDMVMEATKMTIELTQAPEDVQSIYRVNKSTYERLKAEFSTEFAELLDLFKARKEELK